jgi:hypothetical protein
LDRDLARAQAKSVIDVVSPLLRELVNHATNVFARCDHSSKGGPDEDVALLSLYRHMFEACDAVEVLLSQAVTVPCIPHLRTQFEALLAIEHILADPGLYIQRSLSWLVAHVHDRLDLYDRLDPSTPKGAMAEAVRAADSIGRSIRLPDLQEVVPARDNLKGLLTKPHLVPIEAEYQSFARPPHWYALYGGKPNLRDLAVLLNRGAQYDYLYRYWSKVSHAHDFVGFIDGEGSVRPLRNPRRMTEIARFAASFQLAATRLVLGKFRPAEDLEAWYLREIKQRFDALCQA